VSVVVSLAAILEKQSAGSSSVEKCGAQEFCAAAVWKLLEEDFFWRKQANAELDIIFFRRRKQKRWRKKENAARTDAKDHHAEEAHLRAGRGRGRRAGRDGRAATTTATTATVRSGEIARRRN